MSQKLATCLWFDHEALEAVMFYLSIFKDGKIGKIHYYGDEGFDIHGKPKGTVLLVNFEIMGMNLIAMNGGNKYKLSEAMSLVVTCDTQEEIDYYFERLTELSDPKDQVCGWLKDQFGLSWQVVPSVLYQLMSDSNSKKVEAVMHEVLKMKKIDIQTLLDAYQKA